MNIFVGSLPFSLGEADLRESFEAYGQVDSVKIIIDRTTGRSKGFGFVEMLNEEEAQRAISELNGATVSGRTIVVNQSDARPQQPQRKSFGGGGGGNRSFSRDNNRSGGFNRDNNRSGGYNSDRSGGYNSDRSDRNGGGGYNRGGGRY
ncbi:RNA recognition motif domain-containing protein [Flavobacterium sp. RHBU_3]|uniref:RNA recognition motif domain-containing protein n=1 Tax=Flavobacterium sp. RHBU_3 TaxID=3391184 RepID=UPI003984847D